QTTVVAGHVHALDSFDITEKALSGDISGQVPGPLTVNAIKGMPISATIPALTTAGFPADVVWVWDRAALLWRPVERNIAQMTLASIPLDTQRLKYNATNEGFEPEYEWHVLPFSEPEPIAVLGTNAFYATEDRIIDSVRISLGQGSTGVTTIDVNLNGTTIFTTQANRPELAIAALLSAWETPDITAWDTDDYLSVDIDTATGDAKNLMVYVKWRVA
ncbi:unnamed protein product, partial [marine sediment metagenome]